MKLKTLIMAATFLSLCGIATTRVQAGDMPQTVSISLTTYKQSASVNDGTFTTTPKPEVKKYTVADLLTVLAQDTHQPNNAFPAGSKLVVTNENFQVWDSNNNVLVDVTELFSMGEGDNEVFSGKVKNSNGLASPSKTKLHLFKLGFDDTSVIGGVGIKFFLRGVMTETTVDSAPNPTTRAYTETHSARMPAGVGEGTDSGHNQFICTGSISATGHATFVLPP